MKLLKEIKEKEIFFMNIVKKTLQLAESRNCTIQVSIRKTVGINVSIRNSIVDNVEYNNDGALCITVYNRFSKGTVSSKDFSLHSIEKMLDKALSISEYSSSDFFSGLPDSNLLYSHSINLDLFHPWDFNIKHAITLAQNSEESAFKYDAKIINSEGSYFNSQVNIIVFGNSLGILEKYKSTLHSIYTCVISQENNIIQRDFDYSIARHMEELEKSDVIGRNAAMRAVSRLGSKRIKTTKSAVIFSASLSSSFFSHLVNAISGNNIYQKSTFLINDLEKRIFPDWLNIKEEPHIEKGLGSKPFDNEGVATYKKYIVKNGVLKNWLLNSYIARKLHLTSTGNDGGIYNWLITHKNLSFLELIKNMNQGLLVTELMGQGVDIVSGHYSRGAVGFWIENGDIKYPVNEITIAGNLKDMWNNIISISNDIDTRSNIQCGSILVAEMQIAGE